MKRPLLCGLGFYIAGILGGQWCINTLEMVLFYCCIIFLAILLLRLYDWKVILLFPILTVVGMVVLQYQWKIQDPPFSSLIQDGMEVKIEGTVTDLRKLMIETKYIEISGIQYKKESKIRVYLTEEQELAYEDDVKIRGKLYHPQPPRNPGGFDQELYMATRSIEYVLYGNIECVTKSNRGSLKQWIYSNNVKIQSVFDRLLPVEQASILKAMLLGDKDSIASDTREIYQATGIAHILAISGLHISILGLFILQIFKFLKVPQVIRSIGTIILLFFYCIFTGSSISTIRAVVMMSIVLSAPLFRRTADIYTSVGVSASLLLLMQPLYLWDVGFQLSYGAVAGLILIGPLFDQIPFLPIGFKKMIGASSAVFISTAPIMAYHFYRVPLISILLNLLVIPLVPLVISFGICGGLLGLVWMQGARFVIGIVYFILFFFEKVSNLAIQLPLGSILIGAPPIWKMILYYSTISCILLYFQKKKLFPKVNSKQLIPILGISIFCLVYSHTDYLEEVFLDVGQGDCIVIHTPSNQHFMIDGGGNIMKSAKEPNIGIQTVLPYLSYRGISKLNGVFVTHFDGDHVLGIIELLDYVKIEKIFIPAIEPVMYNNYYYQLLEKAVNQNIPVYPIEQGYTVRSSNVNFYCIYPPDHIILNDVEDQNHSSLVLQMNYQEHLSLFTGDIEKEDEKWITKRYPFLATSVLKVPHHGSNTSSTEEFINTVKPDVAIISSGRNNSYGHPHKEVVERYVRRDIPIYNTATNGAIIIKVYSDEVRITSFLHTRKDLTNEENKK